MPYRVQRHGEYILSDYTTHTVLIYYIYIMSQPKPSINRAHENRNSLMYKSNKANFIKKLLHKVKRNMVKVALFIEGKIKSSMTTSNLKGTNPSSPGQVPHVGEGSLRNSIESTVKSSFSGKEITAYVGVFRGPAAKYARRLELGFSGTDSRGRNYNQQPRPFLKPSLSKNRNRIIQIIKRG